MKTNMTCHARFDRADRINYIIDTIGIGEVLYSISDSKTLTTHKLTSTGVVLIMGQDDTLVTAYISTMNEAIYIFRHATNRREMPKSLYNTIRNNEKLHIKKGKTILK